MNKQFNTDVINTHTDDFDTQFERFIFLFSGTYRVAKKYYHFFNFIHVTVATRHESYYCNFYSVFTCMGIQIQINII